jgi:hypothetical protein
MMKDLASTRRADWSYKSTRAAAKIEAKQISRMVTMDPRDMVQALFRVEECNQKASGRRLRDSHNMLSQATRDGD